MSEPLPAVKDREVPILIGLIRRETEAWEWLAGVYGWMIDYDFHREDSGRDDDHQTLFARTNALWRYLHAKICFHLPAAKSLIYEDIPATKRAERLELQVVHELMHVLLKEMEEDSNDPSEEDAYKHQERVAESLARVIIETANKAYKAGYADAKKGRSTDGRRHPASERQVADAYAGPGDGPKRAGRAR